MARDHEQTCCETWWKSYLSFVNIIVAIFGAVMAGFAIYALAEYPYLEHALPHHTFVVSMVVGFLVLGCGVFGFVAARKEHRCMLFIYVGVMLAVVGFQCYVGAAGLQFVKDVKNNEVSTGGTDAKFNEFVGCTYAQCCGLFHTDATPADKAAAAASGCPTATYKKWVGESSNKNSCGLLPAGFADANCENAEGLPDFATFRTGIVTWFEKHQKPLGVIVVVAAVVELFTVLGALHLLCCVNRDSARRQGQKEPLYQEVPANALTGQQQLSYA